jgi:DNA uptake protein ComE-like DNA-binding protein
MNSLNSSLHEILSKNGLGAKQKFTAKLTAEMSHADGEGHVYGYIPRGYPFKKTNFKMKLGRTQKFNPEDRVAEWGGKLVFSVRTVCNRKLERLVHLIFDAWHIDVENEETGKSEIEWFHFTEKIHVATLVNMLNDIMSDMHMSDDEDSVPIVDPVTATNNVLTHANVPNVQNVSNVTVQAKAKAGFPTGGINTASHHELILVTGIADGLAIRILDYRKSRKFTDIEDIKNVPYIKEAVFNKCKHQICV